jgi:hypothetical protein
MVGEVKSAAEATKIASTFLKQYYYFQRPISAIRENTTWIVKIDIGVLHESIAEIKIDASTADITGYSLPG